MIVNGTRIKKINSEFQKAAYEPISKIVKEKYGDNVIISVTRVETLEDLTESKIFLSIYDAVNKTSVSEVLALIVQNAGKVREHIAHAVNLRTTPKFKMLLDESQNQLEQIGAVIEKIKKGTK